MFSTILIIFFTLVGLMALHEFGHFVVAKKFGVKVEEFGFGYPPRIWGKKIGETIYSLNLLPFGAFVKILGSDEKVKNPRSFSEKSLYKRALILFGGVVSFWLIAFIILWLTITFWRVPVPVSDDFRGNFKNVRVLVSDVLADSPAEKAGLKISDQLLSMKSGALAIAHIDKTQQVIYFTEQHLDQPITLTIKRGNGILDVSLVPKILLTGRKAQLGIGIVKVAEVRYPWHEAPGRAALAVYHTSSEIPKQMAEIIVKKIKGKKVVDVEFVGPIGIGKLMGQALSQGIANFLTFVSMLAIWLALFNLFPIPALDGGRLLFLGIEGVRRKPVSQKLEQRITATFFALLIFLMVLVTIKDIRGLF